MTAKRGAPRGAGAAGRAQAHSSVSSSIRSASAERWSASRSTVSRPARSCASRRNTCAWCASRRRFIRRSVSPALRASRARRRRAKRGEVGRRIEHAVVQQLIQQQRMAGDELRRPARGADDARDALERLGMLGEEREVGGAAGDRLEQRRCRARASLPGRRARCRPRERRHHARRGGGANPRAARRSAGSRAARRAADAPARRSALGCARSAKMPRNAASPPARCAPSSAEKACQAAKPSSRARRPRSSASSRQVVALRVVEVLQAMLDARRKT